MLLCQRRFLPLFLTQFLGAFNDNIYRNAFAILITYRLSNWHGWTTSTLVAFATALFMLPFFLFSATAGEIAERFERSRLIVIAKSIEIVLMGLATFGLYVMHVGLLLTILFLLGAQTAFFGPLKYVILPQHLSKNELLLGNGWIEASTFAAILLGTVAGSLLILKTYGVWWVGLLLMGVSMIGWIISRYIPLAPAEGTDTRVDWRFWRDIARVMRYAAKHRTIFLIILGISWFWLVGAIFLSELAIVTKTILHANPEVVTTFFALFAVGIGVGAIGCHYILRGAVKTTYVPWGALGMAIFTGDFVWIGQGMAHEVVPAALWDIVTFWDVAVHFRLACDFLLFAVFGGLFIVPLYALLQIESHPSHRARVLAANNIWNALFMVFGTAMTMGLLWLGASLLSVFLLTAIGNLLLACGWWLRSVRR